MISVLQGEMALIFVILSSWGKSLGMKFEVVSSCLSERV